MAEQATGTDDVVDFLTMQHEQIKSLFAQTLAAPGDERGKHFGDLCALLAVHETGEELVLRPVTEKTAGSAVTDARNKEEKEATEALAELEKMDPASEDFLTKLRSLQTDVVDHAEKEEHTEFPTLRDQRTAEEREKMGRRLRSVEKMAPTHPHPTAAGSPVAQAVTGPFAAIVDRVKDALSSDGG